MRNVRHAGTTVGVGVMAGLVVGLLAAPVAAQTVAVKPGLWEMTIASKMVGEGLPAGAGSNTMKLNICIKPEDAKAGWEEMVRNMQPGEEGECSVSDLKQSGGSYSFTTRCKSGMSGKMTGKISPTEMQQSGDMEFADKSTPMKMTFNNTGKWLAPTCPPGTLGAK